MLNIFGLCCYMKVLEEISRLHVIIEMIEIVIIFIYMTKFLDKHKRNKTKINLYKSHV